MPNTQAATCMILLASWALASSPPSFGQENSDDTPVTRAEFDRFLEEFRQFKSDYSKLERANTTLSSELADLKAGLAASKDEDWRLEFERTVAREREITLNRVRRELGSSIDSLLPGLTNITLGGGAVAGYQNRENVDSTFGVGLAPILLWQPSDRWLFETEIAFVLSEEDSEVELDYAQISYLVNDHLTIGAGKFLMPFGTFWERWHPSWINKLPTIPLIYERGLMGQTGIGVQVRGGVPVGSTKLNYAAYLINGPEFRSSFASAGNLGFGNHRDSNNNKAFGGRIGFQPIPELEFGFSLLSGRVGESGSEFSGVDTVIQGVDLMYSSQIDAIKGRLDLRAEAIWVDTDNVIFTGPFDPFTFDNKRNGWFVQAAYRPTLVDVTLWNDFELRNLEFVARYDQLRQQGAGDRGVDHDQFTFGLDYWVKPNMVLKAAYLFDNAHGGEDENGFFLQMAIGL